MLINVLGKRYVCSLPRNHLGLYSREVGKQKRGQSIPGEYGQKIAKLLGKTTQRCGILPKKLLKILDETC